MGDGRNDVRQVYGEDFSSDGSRILREYDFFSEAIHKLKHVYKLPIPENPEALREFFVSELVGVPTTAPAVSPEQDQTNTTSLKGNEKKQEKMEVMIKKKEEVVLLFEKVLDFSDLITDELSILKSEKVMGFLSEEERRIVEGGGVVKVSVRGEESESDLLLRKSKVRRDGALVLTNEWWRVMYVEGYITGDIVRGWASRLHHQKILIKFTAVKRPRPPLRG